MNKRDVPGRLLNEPEQFDIFSSKVQLLFNLKEQCGVVVLLLDFAQDSCPGHLNKTNIDGFCCHQSPAWAAALCLEGERTLRGSSGCRISPAQLFGVLKVMSWCPKLLPETQWLKLYPKMSVFYPCPPTGSCCTVVNTNICCLRQEFTSFCQRTASLCPSVSRYMKSVFEAGTDMFVPLLFPRFIKW